MIPSPTFGWQAKIPRVDNSTYVLQASFLRASRPFNQGCLYFWLWNKKGLFCHHTSKTRSSGRNTCQTSQESWFNSTEMRNANMMSDDQSKHLECTLDGTFWIGDLAEEQECCFISLGLARNSGVICGGGEGWLTHFFEIIKRIRFWIWRFILMTLSR